MKLRSPYSLAVIFGLLVTSYLLGLRAGGNSTAGEDGAPLREASQPATNRRPSLAAQIVEAYPAALFAADLAAQAEKIVGKEVVDEARSRFEAQITAGAFRSERMEYLVQHFDERELEALLAVVRTDEGLRMFRKLPAYMESWRERVAPVFYEALTNAPAQE